MPKETTKYKPEYDRQAYKAGCAGFTDKDLADMFGVNVSTITRWKQNHETFCTSFKKGKDDFDSDKVENALLRKALGFEYKETQTNLGADGEPILEQTRITHKIALPDTGAIAFWLKNRKSKRWKDKIEQIITDERSTLDFSKLTNDELDKFKELFAKCEVKE